MALIRRETGVLVSKPRTRFIASGLEPCYKNDLAGFKQMRATNKILLFVVTSNMYKSRLFIHQEEVIGCAVAAGKEWYH